MSTARKHVARNVLGELWKQRFNAVHVITNTVDGNSLSASSDLIATCWGSGGGGTVAILRSDQLGEKKPEPEFFRGHTGAVQDIQFCPFYSTIFATASEDTTIKLWDCGANLGGVEPKQDAVATMKGHSKRVCFTAFNEVAEWVLASGALDGTVKVWDIEVQASIRSHILHTYPTCLRWNAASSLLALTSKNRELLILDPRQDRAVSRPVLVHDGAKPAKLDWCKDDRSIGSDYIVTTGFSKSAERQVRVWDTRYLSTYVSHIDLDRGSATLQPFVDAGTGLLVLSGRGNRSIYFYGLEADDIVKFGELEQVDPWKDIAFAPKRCVDTQRCEILRCYGSAATGYIQPISLLVPRRNTNLFQADLYPDCPLGEPALRAESWFGGANAEIRKATFADVQKETEINPMEHPRICLTVPQDSRDNAPVRSTSSVLKKRLSVTAQTTKSMQDLIKHLEVELAGKLELIANLTSTVDQLSLRLEKTSLPISKPPAAASTVGISLTDATGSSTARAVDVDRKLAVLSERVTLTEEELAQLRKQVARRKDADIATPETPDAAIKLLLQRISTLERRNDKLSQRNRSLESVYTAIRKL